ncbi:hypothetical protein PMZ80_005298 [Knufia obscura]|uniref:ubiquitinyl hydrolase 1 n=2 Tax=Knufia TaxID=430999 RepID=A0AAN8IC10_9EURO|nr:hypothetical protein PMZ80_005298 [Knufia obscura]KAK5957965.1 hypothetical protein OHC33_001155 [Knufia fluminis]
MDKLSASHLVKQLSASSTPKDEADEVSYPIIKDNGPTWGFDHLPVYEASIRGGGCIPSTLCDKSMISGPLNEEKSNREVKLRIEQKEQSLDQESEQGEEGEHEHKTWPGWAELENDPEIFTILLQEWGVPNVHVNEILDIAELITANPIEVLGLIFLSRYVPPNQSGSSTPAQELNDTGKNQELEKPWFANQISKFSCGTVALMNILMNAPDLRLSETLSTFRQDNSHLNSKYRGIALDDHAHFRDIHNSFSTKLDRMIVDVLVKDDAQKWKQRKAQQARIAAQERGQAGRKRKRGGRAPHTQRKKKTAAADEDEENGFHFVAYVPAQANVWKLDGMQAHPRLLGPIGHDQTWLNVAAEDLLQKMQEALSSGQECSLMSVTKTNLPADQTEPQQEAQRLEKERKQEDWAPFIETMLRLHAEKGDLQDMLGL